MAVDDDLSQLPPGVSVVVPVYNSERTLETLAARVEAVMVGGGDGRIKEGAADPAGNRGSGAFEIVMVNDASRDGSWAVIEMLAGRHAFVRGINLMRNAGQHNALLCGIRSARFDRIVTIDDDLQNPPEEIWRLLDRLDGVGSGPGGGRGGDGDGDSRGIEGGAGRGDRGSGRGGDGRNSLERVDVVYGRPEKQRHGLLRDLASQITKLMLQRAMGAQTARNISAFRALRTEVRRAFAGYANPYVSIDVLLTWGTMRFAAIPVRHEARAVGASNYTVGKLIVHAMNMVTGFSTWPLRLANMIGFLFTLFGFGVLGFVLLRYMIQGSSVQGFAFLASIIAIFAGAQLFALGIMGEYLARVHVRTLDRPAYTVRGIAGQVGGITTEGYRVEITTEGTEGTENTGGHRGEITAEAQRAQSGLVEGLRDGDVKREDVRP